MVDGGVGGGSQINPPKGGGLPDPLSASSALFPVRNIREGEEGRYPPPPGVWTPLIQAEEPWPEGDPSHRVHYRSAAARGVASNAGKGTRAVVLSAMMKDREKNPYSPLVA